MPMCVLHWKLMCCTHRLSRMLLDHLSTEVKPQCGLINVRSAVYQLSWLSPVANSCGTSSRSLSHYVQIAISDLLCLHYCCDQKCATTLNVLDFAFATSDSGLGVDVCFLVPHEPLPPLWVAQFS